jgi:hypothetical protein
MSTVCQTLPWAHSLKSSRMTSTWRPQLQPPPACEESHERPAKCQRCQEREEEFWSLAESHQLIAELLEAAEQENARLRAQR